MFICSFAVAAAQTDEPGSAGYAQRRCSAGPSPLLLPDLLTPGLQDCTRLLALLISDASSVVRQCSVVYQKGKLVGVRAAPLWGTKCERCSCLAAAAAAAAFRGAKFAPHRRH